MSHALTFRAAVLLTMASAATAQQVVLEPVKDNTIFLETQGVLSNGAGNFFIAGRSGSMTSTEFKRALIEFDVAGALPAGAVVTGATFTLHMRMTSGGAHPVEMRRVIQEWGEEGSVSVGGEGGAAEPGDATWLHAMTPSAFWAIPGGDFSLVQSAIQTVNQIGFYSWTSAQLASDVQDMLDLPAANHGWILIGNEGLLFTAKLFSSREWSVPLERPKLTIDYTLPATAYCTAGTSASGCQALLSASGTPSATAPSGFWLQAASVEGAKDGLFYFGTSGQQAAPWGNGTSYQCVAPPVKRGGLLGASGTVGSCEGSFSQDMNALWCPTCPKPGHNPGWGTVVQAQLWYRDPLNTSNQSTSFSDALEFLVQP